jgi:hypothetical protein
MNKDFDCNTRSPKTRRGRIIQEVDIDKRYWRGVLTTRRYGPNILKFHSKFR